MHACNARGRMYSPGPSRGRGLTVATRMQRAVAAAKRESRRPMMFAVRTAHRETSCISLRLLAKQSAQQQLHHGCTCRRKRLSLRMSDVAAELTGNGKLRARANDEAPVLPKERLAVHCEDTISSTRDTGKAAGQATGKRQQGERMLCCRVGKAREVVATSTHAAEVVKLEGRQSHTVPSTRGERPLRTWCRRCPRAQGTEREVVTRWCMKGHTWVQGGNC